MNIALLDVNVLIALLDRQHQHHGTAHTWFQKNRSNGWATRPITENGAVRIISQPTYSRDRRFSSANILARLRYFCTEDDHVFWPDDVSLRELTREASAHLGPNHLTDVYLLALARSHAGQLATFDQNIPLAAAEAGPEHLQVIRP